MVPDAPAPAKPSGVLRPWQRRLYSLLLVPIGLIAANSIFIAAFTRDTAFFYAMLLLHLTLGVLIAVPFFVFAATHARRMIRTWNRRAKAAGLAIFALALVCVSTGVTMALRGATLSHRPIWIAHVASVPLALVAFILHRRAHTHRLQFRRLFAWGGAVAVFLAGMAVLAKLEKPPRRIVNMNGDTVFLPVLLRDLRSGSARRPEARGQRVLQAVPPGFLPPVGTVRPSIFLVQQPLLPKERGAHGGPGGARAHEVVLGLP